MPLGSLKPTEGGGGGGGGEGAKKVAGPWQFRGPCFLKLGQIYALDDNTYLIEPQASRDGMLFRRSQSLIYTLSYTSKLFLLLLFI